MSTGQEDEKSQVTPPVPQEAQASPASPKMILQELEKSVANSVVPPVENVSPEPVAPPPEAVDTPLITDAMRRLEDLLARFRNQSQPPRV